jgi:hypothetical protein
LHNKKIGKSGRTSSIERLSEIKVSASIEVLGKNATLAIFNPLNLIKKNLLAK